MPLAVKPYMLMTMKEIITSKLMEISLRNLDDVEPAQREFGNSHFDYVVVTSGGTIHETDRCMYAADRCGLSQT